MDAILAGCDRSTHGGRRDHALLLTLYNTGARVSELIAVRHSHVRFGATAVGSPVDQDQPLPTPVVRRRGRSRARLCVPQRARRPPDEAGRHPSARSGLPASSGAMSEPGRQARVAACRPSHHRDAPAPGRRRHGDHRAVARPRATRDYPSIRRGGPATQGRRSANSSRSVNERSGSRPTPRCWPSRRASDYGKQTACWTPTAAVSPTVTCHNTMLVIPRLSAQASTGLIDDISARLRGRHRCSSRQCAD